MASPKNASIIIIFGIVGICIAMAIIRFWPNSECGTAEGFADSKTTVSCPRGSNSYTDNTGAINCCSGTVNGNICEGTVKCTFSGSLTNKYPLCGKTRRRKFTGDIYPFVKQIVESDPSIFWRGITFMEQFQPQLKQLVPSQLSDETYKKYVALVKEENLWKDELNSDFAKGDISREDAIIAIQEEIMYIFNRLPDIFKGQPIASNRDLIQKEFQSQVCKKL